MELPEIEDTDGSILTIDGLVEIFSKTILHPFLTWSIPAIHLIYTNLVISKEFIFLVILCAIVDISYLLSYLNTLYISNGSFRKLNITEDIILITGASSGLGRKLSAILGIKGFRVVAVDIKKPEFDLPNVTFYSCDISKITEVENLNEKIQQNLGDVTVIINNAGITSNKTILELSADEIVKTIEVNTLSHFWTIKTFIPSMIMNRRGFVVTVSSVLGYIGPAKLSAYCASKGALNAMHDSVTHELANTGVRTLLVTVGQMNSKLFNGVKTPSDFLAPVVSTTLVAEQVVDAIEKGVCGELSLPLYAKLVPFMKVLPLGVSEFVRRYYGMDSAMDGYSQVQELVNSSRSEEQRVRAEPSRRRQKGTVYNDK